MRFAEAAALHEVALDWHGERQLVEHADLEAYSLLVGKFCSALGDAAEDSYWSPVVRLLKRARWEAATTPLPLSSPGLGLSHAEDGAVSRLRQCREIAPELASAAEDLADRIVDLTARPDDPLGDTIRDLLSARAAERAATVPVSSPAIEDPNGQALDAGAQEATLERGRRVALLLKSGRHGAEVRAAMSAPGAPPVGILTPAQLATSRPLDLVVAIGPTAWFPQHAIWASRAHKLVFIYPAWVQDSEPQSMLLAGSGSRWKSDRIARPAARLSRPFDPQLPLAPASEWEPAPDWRAISAAGQQREAAEGGGEPVDAYVFALASDQGVFLDAEEGSRAYVAEIEDSEVSIHQELTARIGRGDFLVLRTEGEGDYVRAIADSILRQNAGPLRALQAAWKRDLAAKVSELGVRGLRDALEKAGAVRATDNNIRQWLRPDSIRTRDPADFSAIAAVIGQRDRFRELWDAMGQIDSAHRRAGFQVRALLVDEIRRGDHSPLAGRGWADFDVKEIQGEGALRVVRVEGRAPEPQKVARTRTRTLFTMGRDLWLG